MEALNIQPLDYAVEPPILMLAETEVERQWRVHACMKEPDTVAWMETFRQGDVLWDVGASTGPYSLVAARLGCTVVAFEPSSASYAHLCFNVWLNGLSGVVLPRPFAIGRAFGPVDTVLSPVAGGGQAHTEVRGEDYREAALTCDGTVFGIPTPQPQHIKVDVDGAEVQVMEALRPELENAQSVLVELNADTEADGTAIMLGMGYLVESRNPRWGDKGRANVVFRRGDASA